MSTAAEHFACPIIEHAPGRFTALKPVRCETAFEARGVARALANRDGGAVAFSREGDEIEILRFCGVLPDDLTCVRDIIAILSRVEAWAGSLPQAYAWYRAQPLPGFGDLTAERLVHDGRSAAVLAYLDQIADGGFA